MRLTVPAAVSSLREIAVVDALLLISISLSTGIFKKSMGARHRVGIGLSYRPARLHGLAEFIPWNLFLGSIKV